MIWAYPYFRKPPYLVLSSNGFHRCLLLFSPAESAPNFPIHLRQTTKMSMIQSDTSQNPDKQKQKTWKHIERHVTNQPVKSIRKRVVNRWSTSPFRRVWWFIPCIHALMRRLPPWKSHGGHIPRWWLGWTSCRWTPSRCTVEGVEVYMSVYVYVYKCMYLCVPFIIVYIDIDIKWYRYFDIDMDKGEIQRRHDLHIRLPESHSPFWSLPSWAMSEIQSSLCRSFPILLRPRFCHPHWDLIPSSKLGSPICRWCSCRETASVFRHLS